MLAETSRALEVLVGRRMAVLTGAGCSTESGIPDYRGEGSRRARTSIRGPEFIANAETRRRYWARATIGWERFHRAEPNAAHHALVALERRGLLTGLITQNVDRLHHAAGHEHVIELHGALAEVRCLTCGAIEARPSVQRRLVEANPGWTEHVASVAPDGDADLPMEIVRSFRVVDCRACGGALKPNVVFFGENVARSVVDAAFAVLERADALLIVGTSLAVFSGYRFLRRARELGKPIVMVNLGPVRGEDGAFAKIQERAGTALPILAEGLAAHAGLRGSER